MSGNGNSYVEHGAHILASRRPPTPHTLRHNAHRTEKRLLSRKRCRFCPAEEPFLHAWHLRCGMGMCGELGKGLLVVVCAK
jgi:hypothetical protein